MKRPEETIHYIHRMSYTVQERLVGIFVLSALAIIFVLMIINSKTAHIFEERITLNTFLTKAEGISTETPVKISGIEVGKVTSLDIAPDHRIHVTLIVYKRYQPLLRSDSKAALGKLSVLGKSVIDITAGSTNKPMLADGDTIEVEEPLSVDELLAELTPVIKNVENTVERLAEVMDKIEPQKVESIVTNLDESAQNIRRVTTSLNQAEGTIGMAINDRDFRTRFSNAVSSIDRAFVQMDKRLAELEGTSTNLSKSAQDLPAITAEFKAVLNNTNALLGTMNMEMQEIPQLVTRMNTLMEQTDRLLEGINNSWLFSSEEGRMRRKLIEVQPYHE